MQHTRLSGHRGWQRHALPEPDMAVDMAQYVFPNLRQFHLLPLFQPGFARRGIPPFAIPAVILQSGLIGTIIFHSRAARLEGRTGVRVLCIILRRAHYVPARPCFDVGSTPRTVDQPHRNARFGMDELAEIVSHGREYARGFRLTFHPLSGIDILLLLESDFVADRKQPDIRVGRRYDFSFAAGRWIEPPLHIRLSAAKPHVAHYDVCETQFIVASRNGHFTRGRIGTHGRKHRFPASRTIGLRRNFSFGETHCDQFVF